MYAFSVLHCTAKLKTLRCSPPPPRIQKHFDTWKKGHGSSGLQHRCGIGLVLLQQVPVQSQIALLPRRVRLEG
jgi:hypothetical protein